MTFIKTDYLLKLLRIYHTHIIDGPKLFKQVLEDVRDSHYHTVSQRDPSIDLKTKVIVSKLDLSINNQVEIWVEFCVPKENGYVVGTHVYELGIGNGSALLRETYGTIFET